MKLYDCTLWVSVDKSGNPLHTVPKKSVTELELKLLQGVHTFERVKDVKEAGTIEREERHELLRLCRCYGDVAGIYADSGRALIRRIFSVDLHEFENWLSEQVEQEEAEREERMRQSNIAYNLELARAAAAAASANQAILEKAQTPAAPRKSSAEALLGKKQPDPEEAANLE